MHDDVREPDQVRIALLDAADRIEPPVPDVAAVRTAVRRRAVIAAAALVGAVAVAAVAWSTLSANVRPPTVTPAGDAPVLFSMTSRDERRPRDDDYSYLYGRLRHRSSHPVEDVEFLMTGAIGRAPKTSGLRSIDTDCYWNPMRPRNQARYCFARYAVVRDPDPRYEYRVGFLQGLSQTFDPATLHEVRHSFSVTGGEIVEAQPGVRSAMDGDCTPMGIELDHATFSLQPPPWRICGDHFTRIVRDDATFVFEWAGARPPRPLRLRAVIVWRFPNGGDYVLDVAHEQVAR